MAVTRGAIGTTTTGTTATISVPYPAGYAAGQLALLFVETGATAAAPTPPTGFIERARFQVGTNGTDVNATQGILYSRTLDGTEAANVTVNTGFGHIIGKIVTYSGHDTAQPLTFSAFTSSATATATENTAALASKVADGNDIFLAFFAHDRDSATQTTPTTPTFNNIAETRTGLIATAYNGAGGGGIQVEEAKPTADSTGPVDYTGGMTSTIWAGVLVRINAAGSMPTIWNPNDKSQYLTLSNNNLTATGNDGVGSATPVRATAGHDNTSLEMYEVTIGAFGAGEQGRIGWANSTYPMSSFTSLGDANSIAWSLTDGRTVTIQGTSYDLAFLGGGQGSWPYTHAVGDKLQLLIDRLNSKVYFGVNGVFRGGQNPAAGTGGFAFTLTGSLFPTFAPTRATAVTANFKDPTSYGLAGYSMWDGGSSLATNTRKAVRFSQWL